MNPQGSYSAVLRSARGALGCAVVAGTVAFGTAGPARAAAPPRPAERTSVSAMCDLSAIPDWRLARMCRAWQELQAAGRGAAPNQRRGVAARHKHVKPQRRQPPPRPARAGRHRPARPDPDPSARPAKSPAAGPSAAPAAPAPVPVPAPRAGDGRPERPVRPPFVLLGLLLSLVALAYPLRRRVQAMLGPVFSPVSVEVEPEPKVRFTYRPAIDPFSVPLMGLSGPGSPAAARVLALAALEDFEDSALVVVPRPDAVALFGLAEDELLEGGPAGLFLPGNLESALGSMETELAIRREAGGACTRRFLLVADCENERERIERLVAAHPGEVAAVLLGDWPGERAEVDGEGGVRAAAGLADRLPDRLPGISRTAARDRLYTLVPQPSAPRRRRAGLLKKR